MYQEIQTLLEKLTGQKRDILAKVDKYSFNPFESEIDFHQFNELLLAFGYKRVNESFFQFLVNGDIEYTYNSKISSIDQFRNGVDNFQKIALLYFGNFSFAFDELRENKAKFSDYLNAITTKSKEKYTLREKSIFGLKTIPAENTYLFGYLIEQEIAIQKKENPDDPKIAIMEAERTKYISSGIENYESYLISDYMDVYVATSMRENHEYFFVNDFTNQIFGSQELKELKLRWFDPTQAYCNLRMDKGLIEALMLKRAQCTIYLAQEIDTLGKDSELASTLAQGKPVIVYVPEGNNEYLDKLIYCINLFEKTKTKEKILLEILKIFYPLGPWKDPQIRNWLDKPDGIIIDDLYRYTLDIIKKHFDKREKTLKSDHPLGIQVNLTTGVANGLLVVREIPKVIKLVESIVLGTLKFRVEEKKIDGKKYTLLIETISESIFRIITGDELLTNSFWNHYLNYNNE